MATFRSTNPFYNDPWGAGPYEEPTYWNDPADPGNTIGNGSEFDQGESDPNDGEWLYGDPLAGYDPTKWYDLSHDSPKYQIGRAIQGFDPTAGITDEVLAALNALGIGDFTREGSDMVRVTNGDPRFEGDALLDLISGFNSGSGQWGYQVAEGAGSGGGTVPLGGSYTGAGGGSGASTRPAGTSGGGSGASDLSSIIQQLQGSLNMPGTNTDLDSVINGLLTGDMNQGIIDRRVSAARDVLEGQRSAEQDTIQGLLADRGLLGDGPESTAYQQLGERLGGQFGTQISNIYADEAGRADDRMVQALSAATGLTIAEAQQLVALANNATQRDLGFANLDLNRELGLGNLDLSRMLGQGQLALGNQNSLLQNSQFWAQLQLAREQGDWGKLIELITALINAGAVGGAGGV